MTILELTPESPAGTYEVLTSSGSRYLVVVSERVLVTRVPESVPPTGRYWADARYRDAVPLECVTMRFIVGAPGVLQFEKDERRDDPTYVITTRTTTPVTSIRVVAAP
jgi:hypothetical protein